MGRMDLGSEVEAMIFEAIEFVRHAVGGAVHVLDRYEFDGCNALQVARCGRTGRPNVIGNVNPPPTIEQVCHQCWISTPAEQRSRLITAQEAS